MNRKEIEKEKKCVLLRLNIFNTYWDILKRNYKDTQHDEQDFKLYYSIFKEYEEKVFIEAVKNVLKYQSYFPRIDEIVKYIPKEQEEVPKWFDKDLTIKESTQEEKNELEKIIQELSGDISDI